LIQTFEDCLYLIKFDEQTLLSLDLTQLYLQNLDVLDRAEVSGGSGVGAVVMLRRKKQEMDGRKKEGGGGGEETPQFPFLF
jgi:hypothetical protein